MLIGSLIFLCIPIFTSPDFGENRNMWRIEMFWKSFLSFVGILLFFYLNFFWLIPKLYFKKRYAAFGAAVFLSYFFVSGVPALIFGKNHPGQELVQAENMEAGPTLPPANPGNFRQPPIIFQNIFFQFWLVAFVSLLIRVNMRLSETESEKLKTELTYLRSQVNPHFLFNTLNSLYALTLEKSDDAPEAVLRLSKMMRYVISESSGDFVPLQQELDYIENYTNLQKLRISEVTRLEQRIENDHSFRQIPPLLLISFIENAFKYGVNTEKPSYIGIFISVRDNQLKMNVKNDIVAHPASDEKSGTGLSNAKKRLELRYPKKHRLTINESQDFFEVELTISG